jgi:hypothetical protein
VYFMRISLQIKQLHPIMTEKRASVIVRIWIDSAENSRRFLDSS